MAPVVGISQQTGTTQVAVVDAGSRVRIASPVFGPKKQVGTVVSMTRDTLVLRQGASLTTLSLSTSDITGLEVSKGTYSRKRKGALWGLLIGSSAGAAFGYLSYQKPKCNDPQNIFGCNFYILGPDSKGSDAAIGGILGGILGTVTGTLVGMGRRDAWAPATLGAR
jgi:hypothetical protein